MRFSQCTPDDTIENMYAAEEINWACKARLFRANIKATVHILE